MKPGASAGLLARRRVQLLAWASLLGIVGCFVILVLSEQRPDDGGDAIRAALIVFLIGYFGAVLYLRLRKCPACGERFTGTQTRVNGAFKEMSVDTCQHCGASLR